MQNRITTLLTVLFVFAFSFQSFAQKLAPAHEKKLKKAFDLFNQAEYADAMPLYKELHGLAPKDPAINYALGVCHLESGNANEQLKGIAFLEVAASSKSDEVPTRVYYHLGNLYHRAARFDEAISTLEKFKKADKATATSLQTDRLIENCRTGKKLYADAQDVFVQNLGSDINTPHTEYSPLINADDDLLIYTSLQPQVQKGKVLAANTEAIYTSRKTEGVWSSPTRLEFNGNHHMGSIALSADGQTMLVFMGGENGEGNIMQCVLQGDKWSDPRPLEANINTRYMESSASISPNGHVIYFSSNRPGGMGGMDIYKIEKDSKGKWGSVMNLGPEINTPFDDEAPFIHPDGKTLYFHSKGHNSIGGFDIFKSVQNNGKWQKATNMGHPVNTPYNDTYFVLSADGKKGYFSSERDGGQGRADIYFLGIPEEQNIIPLTMIKGRILAGDVLKPVPTKIRVLDKATNSLLQGVYSPNEKTGNYLIILPPGKDYDMIIEAKGYQPHLVRVHIPNQTYFYELYQMIELKPIRQFDAVVGQEVSVKNAFYDTGQKEKVKIDPKKANEAMLVRDSLDTYELLDNIIAAGDKDAFEYFLDLIYANNPIENVDFSAASEAQSKTTAYYNDEKLEPIIINGVPFYTIPAVNMIDAPLAKEAPKVKPSVDIKKIAKVYFETNKSNLQPSFHKELDEVITMLRNNPGLGIEIAGYADAVGNKQYNLELSNKRASSVLEYFNSNGISRRRILAKGFGQTSTENSYKTDTDKQKDRKVEIRILEM